MSAIFGILRFDGGAVSERDLQRMSNALAHRGPEGRKFIVNGAVGLGHCLMRVNGEDLFETQPLYDREADLTLVADCRIDNREELASVFGLNADVIRDMPDSAFILRAYKKWGEDCAAHLLGDFAFAIWEGRKKRLVLGRDHMGQRSILYHLHEDFLIFASELKGVLSHPDVPRTLSDAAIVKRITCFYAAPWNGATLYEGIFGVVGGSIVIVDTEGCATTIRYWSPRAAPIHENRDEAYYVEAYRQVLGAAVACRLRRLRNPAALCYGGGFDSTAIAGLAGTTVAAQGRKLITISSVMPEDYKGPVRHARKWAELCARQMPHIDMRFHYRNDATIFTGMERLFQTSDHFEGAYRFMFDGIYAQAASAGARLIMDGHGGDYTVNPRGFQPLFHFLRSGRLIRFCLEFGPYMRYSKKSFASLLRASISAVLPLGVRQARAWIRHRFSPPIYDGPAKPELANMLCARGTLRTYEAMVLPARAMTPQQRNLSILRSVSTAPCQGSGAVAAAHQLDITRPFHDKRVVELGLAIPVDLYVRKGRDRWLALKALPDIFPREFQDRDWHSDPVLPDLEGMMDTIAPRLRAETALLAQDVDIARVVDFAYLARAFAPLDKGKKWADVRGKRKLTRALAGFAMAKNLSWAQSRNTTDGIAY